ncbi:MAG: glycosyltransferase [Humidesulfovibrio sp.]|jgi:glycosyltransferase involved in cell wall biosynthesis|uniref:glycosyltransferase n=1 Tax=Humidesulfovibrio sp. TaxID=2910988 RepID=UPI002735B86B|nr:glycosyltransferase [Humidesulfovibrio sp.]MDP2849252.1 glycosyltransferase [Humidesulfovibrio sp.]
MPPIRILHLITGLGLGGAETWLARLLSRLPRERFDCRVVSLLDITGEHGQLVERIRHLGVPVESLGLRRGVPSPGAACQLVSLLRQWRPQVLQTWLYHADLLGLLAARVSGCGAAVSWGLRSGYMDFSRYSFSTRLTVRACALLSAWPEAVTANSLAGAEHHMAALGYVPRKLVVLENGVDGALFRPAAEARLRLRSEWGVDENALLIGLVARLDPMKGHAVFCQAARLVLEQFPSARLVFCGPGTEAAGPIRGQVDGRAGELDGLLARHGLEAAAIRLGRRDDMAQVLAALDVLALPSLGEGFPNALAEALACGVPSACLDVGEARRVAGPGGVLAGAQASGPDASRETQAAALAQCLMQVLELSPHERMEMGALGRAHVLAHFGLDGAAERWAAHFESLAAGR